MNYGDLRSNVESAMGRSDIPSYVYTLTTSGLNRDLRLLEMQAETTITADAESETLPSNFLEMESVYIDSGGARRPLLPISEMSQAVRHDSSGQPYYYAVHNGELTFMPVPDGTYTVTVRYYARLSALSADSDTNDVLTNYPGLYLYAALTHAAVWAGDSDRAQEFNAAYTAELNLVQIKDRKRRYSGPMVQRSIQQI